LNKIASNGVVCRQIYNRPSRIGRRRRLQKTRGLFGTTDCAIERTLDKLHFAKVHQHHTFLYLISEHAYEIAGKTVIAKSFTYISDGRVQRADIVQDVAKSPLGKSAPIMP